MCTGRLMMDVLGDYLIKSKELEHVHHKGIQYRKKWRCPSISDSSTQVGNLRYILHREFRVR